jgi:hypothetical protein
LSNRVGSDQLAALLGPDTAAARENPRRPRELVVDDAAYDGCIAVGGERDRPALLCGSNRASADQLGSQLWFAWFGLTCRRKRTCDHERRGQPAEDSSELPSVCPTRQDYVAIGPWRYLVRNGAFLRLGQGGDSHRNDHRHAAQQSQFTHCVLAYLGFVGLSLDVMVK